MNEERWVRNLTSAARGFNEPPPTPRERMWEGIDRARAGTRRDVAGRRDRPWWSRRQVLWPAAVVAALAVGLTVGRFAGRAGEGGMPAPAPAVVSAPVPGSADSRHRTYRLAALPVLQRSETLLLQMRTGVAPQRAEETFGDRAGTLLSQTRLLLGSPAAADPDLGPLLRDLELSLVRIVQLATDAGSPAEISPERRAFDDGLDRTAVLPRIRDQLAAGPVVAGS